MKKLLLVLASVCVCLNLASQSQAGENTKVPADKISSPTIQIPTSVTKRTMAVRPEDKEIMQTVEFTNGLTLIFTQDQESGDLLRYHLVQGDTTIGESDAEVVNKIANQDEWGKFVKNLCCPPVEIIRSWGGIRGTKTPYELVGESDGQVVLKQAGTSSLKIIASEEKALNFPTEGQFFLGKMDGRYYPVTTATNGGKTNFFIPLHRVDINLEQ